MPLRETIIRTIHDKGPLSFRDFMDLALHHPEAGYRSSTGMQQAATASDRSECVPLIGELVARQLEEMWKLLDKKTFTIIEYGAGPGKCCKEIFAYFRSTPHLYQNLHYCIIEKNEAVRQREQSRVCEEAEWFASIDEVPYEPDCILSQEEINHFAVHEVVMQQELMEVYVDHDNDFIEVLRPADRQLQEYLHELNITLPRGYRTEINLDALQWLRRNAAALRKGFLLTIDHGFPANEFFSLSRHRGNLLCEEAMPSDRELYETAGEKNIRSKVNFTALHHWGRRFGLECCGFTSQAHFLHGLGLLPALDVHASGTSCKEKIVQLYRKIMNFSSRFNILVQQKGLNDPKLSGLQFARNYV